MRKIFKISLFALFVSLTACEDATDITQPSELSEDLAYQTVDDLQSGLNGVYAAYLPDAGGNGAGDVMLFNDLFTDNIKRGIQSSGQGSEEFNFALQPSSSFPNTIWGNRYATINFANRTLRAWDRIAPGLQGNEIARANQIKAQLLGLRALCHFDLLQYFTPNYQDPNSPSVIIMDFVPEITEVFPRNTAGEVFEFIYSDLTQASELIGNFTGQGSEKTYFINDDIITAIEAKVALVQGNYALAEEKADAILAQSTEYALEEFTPYQDMWLEDELNRENIFTLSRRQNDNSVASLWYANEPGIDGSPFFEGSNQLFNLFSDDDIRLFTTFIDPFAEFRGPDSPDNILLIGKYRGQTDDGTLINDVKLIRTAELVMIKAECEARDGRLVDAANTVEGLRDKRLMTDNAPQPVYNSTEEALEDILLERRKEFAFEGHRYLDLKRLGTELGIGINRNSVDCASFNALQCGLPSSDYRFTLPIPRNEISANPTIQQNPNY